MRPSTTSASNLVRACALALALAAAGVAGCLTAPTRSPWEAALVSLQQALSYLQGQTPVSRSPLSAIPNPANGIESMRGNVCFSASERSSSGVN